LLQMQEATGMTEEPLFSLGCIRVVKHSGVIYLHVPKAEALVWDLTEGDVLELACMKVWRVARAPKTRREEP